MQLQLATSFVKLHAHILFFFFLPLSSPFFFSLGGGITGSFAATGPTPDPLWVHALRNQNGLNRSAPTLAPHAFWVFHLVCPARRLQGMAWGSLTSCPGPDMVLPFFIRGISASLFQCKVHTLFIFFIRTLMPTLPTLNTLSPSPGCSLVQAFCAQVTLIYAHFIFRRRLKKLTTTRGGGGSKPTQP